MYIYIEGKKQEARRVYLYIHVFIYTHTRVLSSFAIASLPSCPCFRVTKQYRQFPVVLCVALRCVCGVECTSDV